MSELHRRDWPRVAFGDVVQRVSESGIPTAAESETYIGLEHLEPGSFTIRRWGSHVPIKVPKTRIQAGDVLFARRNTHLRRSAVAPFDTYFSPDGYALRVKSDHFLQELLIFIVASDGFMEYAIEHSAGTHSKRVKWSDLARYEFALPPLEEQEEIARALQSLEEAREALFRVREASDSVIGNLVNAHTAGNSTRPFGEVILSTDYGSSARANSVNRGHPILRIPNVLRGRLDLSDLKWVELPVAEVERYALATGDLLVVRTNGNPDYVGRCVAVPQLDAPTLFASYLIRVRVDSVRIHPEFAAAVLNGSDARRSLSRFIRSSAGNYNLNAKGIRGIAIPCPPMEIQQGLLTQLRMFDHAAQRMVERNAELVRLRQSIAERLGR